MRIGSRQFDLTRPVIMGILNITPDSFSDGGLYNSPDRALNHARALIDQGADIIDIGGESTRPGSKPVQAHEEMRRIIPVIKRIRSFSQIPLSVDTQKAAVARAAIEEGADFINDISAGRGDPEMFATAALRGVPICLMHMKGVPETMQQRPFYAGSVFEEVYDFLAERVEAALEAGVPPDAIVLDPGIGFGKTAEDNIALLLKIDKLSQLNKPILVGTSRKSFIGKLLNLELHERLEPMLATLSKSYEKGARFFRVHDVGAARRFFDMYRILSADA